ncbi:Pol [Symbiodinium natans]|uniref:Pol protein n=1 Tax=Symbiodinium natans TaxID=878477 RepID=A0A812NB30_9DINO|nr:Pol [Symbiodinium natans]
MDSLDELKNMYGEMLPSLSTASNTPMGSETGPPNKRPAVASTRQANASKKQGGQKGSKGRGKGRDRPQQQGDRWSFEDTSAQDPAAKAMLKLMLRHEQQLMRLNQDTTLLFTFQNKPGEKENILPVLSQVSQAWKEKMESSEKPTMSLRVTVLQSICAELLDRSKKVMEQDKFKEVVMKQGWISAEGNWNFLKWNSTTESLEVVTGHGILQAELEQLVQTISKSCVHQGALYRMQATRRLAAELTGHQLTFVAEVGLRQPGAHSLHQALLRLQGVAALQLLGLRIHQPRMQIFPLAESLGQCLR